MGERAFVGLQYLLPKRLLTRLLGRLADARAGALTTLAIRAFIVRYRVDMGEAALSDPRAYPTFNAFFTRALRDGARPFAGASWDCPVDGAISQFGRIEQGRIFQAKGHAYTARALLGGDEALAAGFRDGHFATLYLSPRDYHRIHMPRAGGLRTMIHVPGDLFSVNPQTARGVPGLFARNERVVCVFDGEDGPFAMVLVGATVVGSVSTVWHGRVNPPRPGALRRWDYPAGEVTLAQGAEMGRFSLGSTVVVLMPPSSLVFDPGWFPLRAIRMGEAMAAPGA
ncbi:MAG: archaetidylserine decarboxylase [Lautropia sp.]